MLATGSHPFVIMLPQVHKATGNHAFIVHVEKEVKEYGKNAAQQEKYHKHWREILTTKHKLSLAMSNAIRKGSALDSDVQRNNEEIFLCLSLF